MSRMAYSVNDSADEIVQTTIANSCDVEQMDEARFQQTKKCRVDIFKLGAYTARNIGRNRLIRNKKKQDGTKGPLAV